ncbi:hypothetical protein QTP88_026353 [Uroleucon formosanum]
MFEHGLSYHRLVPTDLTASCAEHSSSRLGVLALRSSDGDTDPASVTCAFVLLSFSSRWHDAFSPLSCPSRILIFDTTCAITDEWFALLLEATVCTRTKLSCALSVWTNYKPLTLQVDIANRLLCRSVSAIKHQLNSLINLIDEQIYNSANKLVEYYDSDLSNALAGQILLFRSCFKEEITKRTSIKVRDPTLATTFSEICTACMLFFTLPVTVATAE